MASFTSDWNVLERKYGAFHGQDQTTLQRRFSSLRRTQSGIKLVPFQEYEVDLSEEAAVSCDNLIVLLLYCTVTILYCYYIVLLLYCTVTILYCYYIVLLLYCIITILYCYYVYCTVTMCAILYYEWGVDLGNLCDFEFELGYVTVFNTILKMFEMTSV